MARYFAPKGIPFLQTLFAPDTRPAPRTIADAVLLTRTNTVARDVTLAFAGALLIVATARVAVPLPWTPVPVTGQTFGVLLSAMALGGRRGTAASLLYIAGGAFGLPVFAGQIGGMAPLTGVTAGYLAAFPIAAFVTGTLAERGAGRRVATAFFAMAFGSLIILTLGAVRLGWLFSNLPTGFMKGFMPFVVGELWKAAGAAVLLPALWHVAGRRK